MIRSEVRPDGVAVIIWDLEGQQANVLSTDSIEAFAAASREALADGGVKGVVVASAKRDFLAGADLAKILPGAMDEESYSSQIRRFHRYWRDIETGGKPFVAAINGSALGGGYELAMACHRRIAADNPASRIGLPEVTLSLIPGGGGTQRLPRLIGLASALPIILEGRTHSVSEALQLGMVDEVVPAADLVDRACAWIRDAAPPDATQSWERPAWAPQAEDVPAELLREAEERMLARTRGLQTAPQRALASIREGWSQPMDQALETETRHFVASCFDPQAVNTIRTSFFGVGAARKLASRPADVPQRNFRTIGVLGAGMMGQGIAQVAAAAGLDVALLDSTEALARTGHDRIDANLQRQVSRAITTPDKAAAILKRIRPGADFSALADADLVVEAVFEDRGVKADVTRRAVAAMPADSVFASNTSTLPISGLAEASPRPDLFIGMHFFSPVERMPLVEMIVGEKTSPVALAHALDLIRTMRKVPIVVRDGRGFYTSRVFATFIYEALEMLEEGVAPELIEAGGLLTGLPMSPLALSDQLSIELAYKVQRQERADLGEAFRETAAYRVCRLMVETLGRKGRAAGAGYYDYPQSGEKRLWSGLADQFKPLDRQPDPQDIADRFLTMQSVETLRCLDEGILGRAIDGDIGAVLGWGYPAYRGGPVAYVDTLGPAVFLDRCTRYAQRYGARYAPPPGLLGMVENGARYYSPDPSRLAA